MTSKLTVRQGALLCSCSMERLVRADRLPRSIESLVDLPGIRQHLRPFYSDRDRLGPQPAGQRQGPRTLFQASSARMPKTGVLHGLYRRLSPITDVLPAPDVSRHQPLGPACSWTLFDAKPLKRLRFGRGSNCRRPGAGAKYSRIRSTRILS